MNNNIAYIDGQNLYMGTAKSSPKWEIDLQRLYVYLQKKYGVDRAYYYLDGKNIKSKIEKQHTQKSRFSLGS